MQTGDIQNRQVEPDKLVTPAEAAVALGATVRTLHRWERAERIAAVRLPSGVRGYRQSEIARILDRSEVVQ